MKQVCLLYTVGVRESTILEEINIGQMHLTMWQSYVTMSQNLSQTTHTKQKIIKGFIRKSIKNIKYVREYKSQKRGIADCARSRNHKSWQRGINNWDRSRGHKVGWNWGRNYKVGKWIKNQGRNYKSLHNINVQKNSFTVLMQKEILRSFTKFTRKHLYRNLFFDKVASSRPAAW